MTAKKKKKRKSKAIVKRQINLDIGMMKTRCLQSMDSFASIEGAELVETNHGQHYIFIDRGADILAVAHLDTVQSLNHFYHLKLGKDSLVFSAQLDDRLGAYLILDLLPQLGVECDVLLTEDEESANSSAKGFTTEKEYNWIFQFDRTGEDCVMYQYEDEKNRNRVKSAGYRVGTGSYTDICDLSHLKVKGFNFGTAYYDNHGARAWCDLGKLTSSVNRFLSFYHKHKHIKMDHEDDYRLHRGGYYSMLDYYPNYANPAGYKKAVTTATAGSYKPVKKGWEKDCELCGSPAYECDGMQTCVWCGGDTCDYYGATSYHATGEALCHDCAMSFNDSDLTGEDSQESEVDSIDTIDAI